MSGELGRLVAPPGANRRSKHKGRGHSAGQGKTSGRGVKGQKARKSGHVRPGFEGGQMPMHRRVPKRGFVNPFSHDWAEVRLQDLVRFETGAKVDETTLRDLGMVKGKAEGIKLLGNGEIDRALHVRVNRITQGAKEKIEKAGGSVELIADRAKWVRTSTRANKRAAKRAAG